MRVIPASDYDVMPWKNGGGSTTQVVVRPEGAALDRFDWRVSMAAVGQDGPFSAFPGVDRTLTLLAGPRLVLAFRGPMVALTPQDPTIRFAGEDQVDAAVPEGPVSDFNVMTRRETCRHAFERFALAGAVALPRLGSATLLYLAAGPGLSCGGASGEAAVLGEGDSLLLGAGDPPVCRIAVEAPAIVFRVEIFGPDAEA